MNTKKRYIAPTLRAASYQAEKGYAISLWFVYNLLDQEEYDSNNQEFWDWDINDNANNRFGESEWDSWDN